MVVIKTASIGFSIEEVARFFLAQLEALDAQSMYLCTDSASSK